MGSTPRGGDRAAPITAACRTAPGLGADEAGDRMSLNEARRGSAAALDFLARVWVPKSDPLSLITGPRSRLGQARTSTPRRAICACRRVAGDDWDSTEVWRRWFQKLTTVSAPARNDGGWWGRSGRDRKPPVSKRALVRRCTCGVSAPPRNGHGSSRHPQYPAVHLGSSALGRSEFRLQKT